MVSSSYSGSRSAPQTLYLTHRATYSTYQLRFLARIAAGASNNILIQIEFGQDQQPPSGARLELAGNSTRGELKNFQLDSTRGDIGSYGCFCRTFFTGPYYTALFRHALFPASSPDASRIQLRTWCLRCGDYFFAPRLVQASVIIFYIVRRNPDPAL